MVEPYVMVTDDYWLRNAGKRDETDLAIMKEASPDGHPTFMSTKEMLEAMQREDPAKFEQVKQIWGEGSLIPVTVDKLIEIGQAADKRFQEFSRHLQGMTKEHAEQIRSWRVDLHYTWRSVARAAYMNVRKEKAWRRLHPWLPPSNQIAGQALCEKAAGFFGENFRKAPWN